MERPVYKPIGTPVEQLDTPALVVGVSVLEQNIETVHSFFRQSRANVRPHVAAHGCPAVAQMQLAAGGTVGGISVATVGQAEVFAQQGFSDIFVASEIVTPLKIGRLCALAHRAKITVAADNAGNIDALSEAAQASGVTLNVVVEIHTRLDRCGVEPGQPSVDLAAAISKARALRFAGLMTYEGAILTEDVDELAAESRKWVQQVLDTREMVERAGLDVGVVSAGGTHNYEIVGSIDGVTEVPAGAYALMEQRYRGHRPELRPAAMVMSTVISRPQPGLALLDAGQKAMSTDTELPVVEGLPGGSIRAMSAEHGFLAMGDGDQREVDLGDKVWLTPWNVGDCANVYDFMNAVRDGRLEAVWDIAARGRYR